MRRPGVKPRVPGLTERQVCDQVIAAARLFGIVLARRNTGVGVNPAGTLVRFGSPGDSDYTAVLPGGSHMALEIKKECFDPRTVRGAERERFRRQVAKLREVNAAGGVGLWVRDPGEFLEALRKVLAGWRVEIDAGGFCWLVSPDEPPRLPDHINDG